MKTTIYNFWKIGVVLLFIMVGVQHGFSQIDADIELLSVSPATGPYSYGQKITYYFRVENKSDALYDIDRVVLRDYLPDGLEYIQADNSLTWIDLGGGILEANDNSLIPAQGGTKDFSIVLTVKANNGGADAWLNKIELYEFYNGVTKLSEFDPDNQLNGTDTDFVEYKFDIYDLALKSVTGDVYPNYNTNVNFDITVYNQGSLDAYNVTVVNYTLPGYTFDSALNPAWSFDALTGNWKYTFAGPIAPGDNDVVTVVLQLNPTQNQADWANYAEIVSAEDTDGNMMDDIDGKFDEDMANDAGGKPGSDADNAIDGDGTDVVGGTDPAKDEDNHDSGYAKIYDLALVKTTDVTTTVAYGDMFTFHFTVYNQGTVAAKNIKITDYLPSGYQYNAGDNAGLGWSEVAGNLENTIAFQIEPGNSTTIDLNLQMLDVVSDHTEYVNYAEISSAEDKDGNAFSSIDDSDSEMASNSASERDVLPGSVLDDDQWRDGSDGHEDDFDPGIANFLDLAVRHEVVTPGPYHAGDIIMFSVKVYNQGGISARDIEVIDYIPDGYKFSTFSFPDWHQDAINNTASAVIPDVLNTGDSIELFVYLEILPIDGKFDNYNNIVEISAAKDKDFNILTTDIDSEMDINMDNDAGGMYRTASDDSVLGNGTGAHFDSDALTDEDDYDPALPDVYDLALKSTLLTAGPYQYDQDLTFRFMVYNQGNMAVKDINVVDYLPSGYTVESAPGWTVSGSSISYLFTDDLNPGDSVYVDAVLKVNMTAGGEKDWIQYAEIKNMRDLDDSDKSGWDLDSDLGSNSPEELTVELGDSNDDNILVKGPYASEDEDDHDPAGIEIFDLAVRNIINSIYYPFNYGDNIPFKVTVFNQGSEISKNIKITQSIPCGFEFVLANNPGWTENALNNTVEYEFDSELNPGASIDVTLNLNVVQCLENGDSWVTVSEISYAEDADGNDKSSSDIDSSSDSDFTNDAGGTPDTAEDNYLTGDGKNGLTNSYLFEEDDSDPARVHVFDLALKKDLADQDPHYGDLLTFNITVYNQGNDEAENIEIIDYEPSGYVFDVADNPGWGGSVFTGLTYTIAGPLAFKDSITVPLRLRMIGTDGGSDHWINYAEINEAENATVPSFTSDPDSNPNSDTNTERSVKPGDANDGNIESTDKGGLEDDHDPAGVWVNDLALKKEVITQGPYMHGDTVEFEVTVYNQGNKIAREIQVVDYTPEGLKYSSTSFPTWHSDSYTGNSHCSISSALNPGDSIKLKLFSVVQLVDNKCGDAYTNHAEIFEFRDEDLYIIPQDFDSTPDYIEDNDIGGTPNSPEDNHVADDGTDYNNDGITDEDDSDPAKLEIIDVAVKAELMTAAPYYYGQTQQFRIRVYNQGNDTIRDTEIKAYLPDGYELDFAANPGWNSADSTFKISDQIANCDSFDIFVDLKMVMTPGGEKDWINYFEAVHVLNNEFLDRTDWDMDSQLGSDTAEERSVELGDSNDDNVMVRGVGFDEDQDDHDPAGLEIFDLAMTKSYDDLYPHYYGDTMHFEIKIYNQGSMITANQEITDYIPAGYRFEQNINPDWTYDAGTGMAVATFSESINPGDTLSKYINLILVDSYNAGDDWENGAEISKFEDNFGTDQSGNDFDSTNDQIKDNDEGLDNDDFVEGDGKNGPTHGYPQIEDDADLATPQVFDLALRKTLVTAGPYEYGDNITFEIEVFNQGNQIAENIELNDFIALGYSFDAVLNADWNFVAGKATYQFPNQLLPDDSVTVNIILTLERTDGGYTNWINYAEVASADNPDGVHNIDADSNPDSDAQHERDVKPGDANDDFIFGQFISEDEDEDDHDPAGIEIFDLALRKSITSAGSTFDYGQVIDFTIELFNQGNTDAKNIKIEEEAIPCGFEFNVAANTDWNYNSASRNATYTYTNTILPGETVELHVFMTVWDCHNSDWENSWKNVAEITAAEDGNGVDRSNDDIDSNYDNDPLNDNVIDDAIQAETNLDDDDHDISIASIVDLALKIEADDRGPFAPGDTAPFTITVYNQGNESIKDIKIFDYLSPGYSFISGATNPGWSMYNATTAQYTFAGPLAPRDSFELPLKLMVELGTQISDWTHYAEIGQAVGMNDLVLTDDADAVYASDTPYERDVEVGDAWDNEVLGIGYKRGVDEDMDDHDPASVDVVGKVGDLVWEDKDGDGIQDAGEPGIEGVIVELHNCDPNSGIAVQYDTTDASGAYLFDMVIPGMYFVKFILPGEYQFTLDNVGANDDIDSDVDGTNGNGTTECFEVEANEEQYDIDAGAFICVQIGDLVWLDDNKNNVYDSNETGVNGLKVELYRKTNGVWELWDVEFTGIDPNSVCGDGYYHFCTNPGTYFLHFVTPPTGIVPAQPHRGGDVTKDSDITRANGIGTTNTFYLVSGTDGDLTIDAGYYEQAQITNSLVWKDSNSNGLQDPGEAPMPGVKVEIYDEFGEIYDMTETDNAGSYSLNYLQAEPYYLKFSIPSSGQSYVFTPANQGDDTKDSDVDHSFGIGTTDLIPLASSENKTHVDAGLSEGSLPLNFVQMGAEWKNGKVEISWAISDELNVEKFVVQRAFEGSFEFESIGEIAVVDEKREYYTFVDVDEFKNGVYYYRIVAVDFDGATTYSNKDAVFISNKTKEQLVAIYPNPVVNEASVRFGITKESNVVIDVLDVNGKVAINRVIDNEFIVGNYEVKVDVSSLKASTYYVRLRSDNTVTFKKMIVIGK